MLYQWMVILHVLGAVIWIGGHLLLVLVVLPTAGRDDDRRWLLEFQRGLGRYGLAALAVQLLTGAWLAHRWLGGDWSGLLRTPTPAGHLILTKIVLLILTLIIAGWNYHRTLPRLREHVEVRRQYVILSWATTCLGLLLLVLGVGVRTGGFG